MGLFRSASGVRTGAGVSCGGEYIELSVGDDDVEDDGLELGPRMRAINVAAVWRRHAKFMKDLKIASWTSRFESLCSLVLFEVLIGTALAQQNIDSEYDIFIAGGLEVVLEAGALMMLEKKFGVAESSFF